MDTKILTDAGLPNFKNIKEIIITLKEASDLYYNSGESKLTDYQYDLLTEYLRNIDPNNKVLKEVGAPVKNKVKLPYEMWSMDKIKPKSKQLDSWINKYGKNSNYVISAKLDGVSGLYDSINNKLYTRGDGIEGQDISYMIPYLKLPQQYVTRGEFIISKSNFEKYFKGCSNSRNTLSGIINKPKIDKKEIKYVEFIPYEIIYPQMLPSKQMENLSNGVIYKKVNTLSNDVLEKIYVDWRKNGDYLIDGIICTHDDIYERVSKNPLHSFAYKMQFEEQMSIATVVDVIWTPSKDGLIKPKLKINPVNIGGVIIEYVTAFNASYIVNNNINKGTIIKIIRSGDVIPHIMSVEKQSDTPLMPKEKYHWNDTNIDIILDEMSENLVVIQKNIANFFKIIGVENLSMGIVGKLMKQGYTSLKEILSLSVKDLIKVEGFKEVLSNKIYTNIQTAIKDVDLITLMKASNKFGRGIGEKKIKPIMDKYPDILVSKETQELKIEKVKTVEGMADLSSRTFVMNIDCFIEFLKDIGLEYKLSQPSQKTEQIINKQNPLYEKKIVMTGFRDKEIEEFITKSGGEISSSVSKSTFKLIVKDKNDNSSKIKKAKEINPLIILTKEEFIDMYMK